MTTDPTALREQAREWGRSFVDLPPWEPLSERLSLILAAPYDDWPLPLAPPQASLWLLVDRASASALPEAIRRPLVDTGVVVERRPATISDPAVELTIRTAEAVERSLEGVSRRDLEVRWLLAHAEPIADRLRRLERLAEQARLLPADGLERATRSLWLDAYASVRALWSLPSEGSRALVAAGELAGALLRIACLLDHGAHPTAERLEVDGSDTRIGLRLVHWLDDLRAALGGDATAGRRSVNAAEQVLAEVRSILAERYRDRDWLRDPASYELRSRRR